MFWAKWKFFGKVREDPAAARDERLIKNEMWGLADVCDERVKYHRWTLYFCWVSILAFLVTLLLTIKVIAPLC